MFIEAPELSSHSYVRHAFFTRQGGVSDGLYASLNGGIGSRDETALVAENRARMCAQLALPPSALVSLYQVHSNRVVTVEAPFPLEERPQADAMVTRVPGLALGIATADCGPILFADPENCVVGAAHAGWKGALTGVIANTVAAMEDLGAVRSYIVAVLGPTISQAAYEVSADFVERFRAEAPGSERFFAEGKRGGHAQFDLPGFIVSRLEEAGIGEAVALGLCTYADEERFFSYRRTTHRAEADYGRLISAIALTP
ncbi:peptidoglycan editing factor PgeF [Methylobacterium gnaphalii]|uniref:Purine nucleoside phosphorylase n=1 Tax=Methylobacterium gnaphalii TaxID=1010610 RepID=A0A512JPT5_9HYPH|nr:peptidoglycan editing factor PgeF [Methylobacterium gnaphalii]GEP11957.1 laccase domain protein [Methylobacterium gnaphalii]GJD68693.1 Polyphenol oxidase [Methylobacterium gnaphalii]GLS49409.1 laccase domain protein [Methylobacterium gnaphalii]